MRSSHSHSAGVMSRRARWGRRPLYSRFRVFVLALPCSELPDQAVSVPELGAAMELALVPPMAALHLAIHFEAARRSQRSLGSSRRSLFVVSPEGSQLLRRLPEIPIADDVVALEHRPGLVPTVRWGWAGGIVPLIGRRTQ